MNNKRKKSKHTGAVMAILVVAAILIFIFYKNDINPFKAKITPTVTEFDKLIARDIEGNYPSTWTEVIKLYSRIIKCFYNDKLSDKEINELAVQIRLLFDDELLDNNPNDKYLVNLKAEIVNYKKAGRVILDYSIGEKETVKTWERDGFNYVALPVSYTLKKDGNLEKINEVFLLRENAEKNWKILGWSAGEDDTAE